MPRYRTDRARKAALEEHRRILFSGMEDALTRLNMRDEHDHFLQLFHELMQEADEYDMALMIEGFNAAWASINDVTHYTIERRKQEFFNNAVSVELLPIDQDPMVVAMFNPGVDDEPDEDPDLKGDRDFEERAEEFEQTIMDIFGIRKKGDLQA